MSLPLSCLQCRRRRRRRRRLVIQSILLDMLINEEIRFRNVTLLSSFS